VREQNRRPLDSQEIMSWTMGQHFGITQMALAGLAPVSLATRKPLRSVFSVWQNREPKYTQRNFLPSTMGTPSSTVSTSSGDEASSTSIGSRNQHLHVVQTEQTTSQEGQAKTAAAAAVVPGEHHDQGNEKPREQILDYIWIDTTKWAVSLAFCLPIEEELSDHAPLVATLRRAEPPETFIYDRFIGAGGVTVNQGTTSTGDGNQWKELRDLL
ncbi:unnamed protein product, partial [Amoebophrya sp. A25]